MNHSTTSPAEPPSSRLGRAARRVVIAVLTVVLVAGPILLGPLMMKACEEPADHTYRQKPSVSSEPLTLTGSPWEVCLPNGAVVELIGLADSPSGVGDWWLPDGLPLVARPYTTPQSAPFRGQTWTDRKVVEIAYRIRVPAPQEGYATSASISDNLGMGTVTPLNSRGEADYSLRAEAVLFDKDQKTVTIRLGVAAGDWETIGRGTMDGGTVRDFAMDDGFDGKYGYLRLIAPPEDAPADTVVTAIMDLSWNEVSWRFVAEDASGQVRQLDERSLDNITEEGQPVRRRSDQTLKFTGRPGNVKWQDQVELRLEIRPYHYVEFKNVSLRQGYVTTVHIIGGIDEP